MAAVEDADFHSFLASFGGEGVDVLCPDQSILAPLPCSAPLRGFEMLHDPLLSAGGLAGSLLPAFAGMGLPLIAGMGADAAALPDAPPGGRQQQQQQQGGKKAGGKGLSQSALECNRRHRRKKKEEMAALEAEAAEKRALVQALQAEQEQLLHKKATLEAIVSQSSHNLQMLESLQALRLSSSSSGASAACGGGAADASYGTSSGSGGGSSEADSGDAAPGSSADLSSHMQRVSNVTDAVLRSLGLPTGESASSSDPGAAAAGSGPSGALAGEGLAYRSLDEARAALKHCVPRLAEVLLELDAGLGEGERAAKLAQLDGLFAGFFRGMLPFALRNPLDIRQMRLMDLETGAPLPRSTPADAVWMSVAQASQLTPEICQRMAAWGRLVRFRFAAMQQERGGLLVQLQQFRRELDARGDLGRPVLAAKRGDAGAAQLNTYHALLAQLDRSLAREHAFETSAYPAMLGALGSVERARVLVNSWPRLPDAVGIADACERLLAAA